MIQLKNIKKLLKRYMHQKIKRWLYTRNHLHINLSNPSDKFRSVVKYGMADLTMTYLYFD
jgi:hypothetical protein